MMFRDKAGHNPHPKLPVRPGGAGGQTTQDTNFFHGKELLMRQPAQGWWRPTSKMHVRQKKNAGNTIAPGRSCAARGGRGGRTIARLTVSAEVSTETSGCQCPKVQQEGGGKEKKKSKCQDAKSSVQTARPHCQGGAAAYRTRG